MMCLVKILCEVLAHRTNKILMDELKKKKRLVSVCLVLYLRKGRCIDVIKGVLILVVHRPHEGHMSSPESAFQEVDASLVMKCCG